MSKRLLQVFEFIYYILGFALFDVVFNLIQGNPINILLSLAYSAFFTVVFLILMFFWMLITGQLKNKKIDNVAGR